MRVYDFFYFVFIIYPVISQYVGQKCIPSADVDMGICQLLDDCEVALRSVEECGNHPFHRCGFHGNTEIVCCPNTTTNFGSPVTPRNNQRVADRECQNIVKKNSPPLGPHILDGENATPGEFPHMVAIGFLRTDDNDFYSFDCGGTLISETFVMTAAHCVNNLERIEPSIVRAGVLDVTGVRFNDTTDVRIAQIIQHPSYVRREKYNDIALLRLAKPFKRSQFVFPACLQTSDQEELDMNLIITGWGVVNVTNDLKSKHLQKADVQYLSRISCNQSYKTSKKFPRGIIESQICASDRVGNSDACQGDSGGPIQILHSKDSHYRIVGITSFGQGCGVKPGVYTRVYSFLDWIEEEVWP